jgi:hypothetical protein
MWSLHNPFFLLHNGEFMAKKKNKTLLPSGKNHVEKKKEIKKRN